MQQIHDGAADEDDLVEQRAELACDQAQIVADLHGAGLIRRQLGRRAPLSRSTESQANLEQLGVYAERVLVAASLDEVLR